MVVWYALGEEIFWTGKNIRPNLAANGAWKGQQSTRLDLTVSPTFRIFDNACSSEIRSSVRRRWLQASRRERYPWSPLEQAVAPLVRHIEVYRCWGLLRGLGKWVYLLLWVGGALDLSPDRVSLLQMTTSTTGGHGNMYVSSLQSRRVRDRHTVPF